MPQRPRAPRIEPARAALRPTLTLSLTRRAWLASLAAGWWAGSARAEEPNPNPGEDFAGEEIQAIEARARAAGLGPLRSTRAGHYLAVGNAPDTFQTEALRICEAVADDFVTYYQSKGFDVTLPDRRLSVVLLANAQDFGAYLGIDPGGAVGGLYDLETNRLVIFDFRGQEASPQPERANTVSLVHEATHQLTYNTGLLDRRADVPAAINEGLAMNGEVRNVRRPAVPTPPGRKNPDRLAGLDLALRQGAAWVPVASLLADDSPFDDPAHPAAQQLAYSESWLLVYNLLRNPSRLRGFRSYLTALRTRLDNRHRIEDASSHLGDLDRLDQELRRLVASLLRR